MISRDIRTCRDGEFAYVEPVEGASITFTSFAFLVWMGLRDEDSSKAIAAREIAEEVVSCASGLMLLCLRGCTAEDYAAARHDFWEYGLSPKLREWVRGSMGTFRIKELECFFCCDDASSCHITPSRTLGEFFGESMEAMSVFARWCRDQDDDGGASRVFSDSYVFQLEEFAYLDKALHEGVRFACVPLYDPSRSVRLGWDEAVDMAKRDETDIAVFRGWMGEYVQRELAVDCKTFGLASPFCEYLLVLDCTGYDISEDAANRFVKACSKDAMISVSMPALMLPVRCPEKHPGALSYRPLFAYGEDLPGGVDVGELNHNCFYHDDDRLLSFVYNGRADERMLNTYKLLCDRFSLMRAFSCITMKFDVMPAMTGYDDYMRAVEEDARFISQKLTYGALELGSWNMEFPWDEFDVLFIHMVAVEGFAPDGYNFRTLMYDISRLYEFATEGTPGTNKGCGSSMLDKLLDDLFGDEERDRITEVRKGVSDACATLRDDGLDLRIQALVDGVPFEDVIA